MVSNREEKIEALRRDIEDILRRQHLSPHQASSLRGSLLYAQAQTFGRCGLASLRILGRWAEPARRLSAHNACGGADGPQEGRPPWRRVEAALRFWLVFFDTAVPRVLDCSGARPVLIFSDGACEGDRFELVTVGALIVFPEGDEEYFGFKVPEAIVQRWKSYNREQVVGQAELLPVYVAKYTWAKRTARKRVLRFVDNEAARIALVKGASPSPGSNEVLDAFWELEATLSCSSWFERVPSASNPGDPPSRLEFAHPGLSSVTRVRARWDKNRILSARW